MALQKNILLIVNSANRFRLFLQNRNTELRLNMILALVTFSLTTVALTRHYNGWDAVERPASKEEIASAVRTLMLGDNSGARIEIESLQVSLDPRDNKNHIFLGQINKGELATDNLFFVYSSFSYSKGQTVDDEKDDFNSLFDSVNLMRPLHYGNQLQSGQGGEIEFSVPLTDDVYNNFSNNGWIIRAIAIFTYTDSKTDPDMTRITLFCGDIVYNSSGWKPCSGHHNRFFTTHIGSVTEAQLP